MLLLVVVGCLCALIHGVNTAPLREIGVRITCSPRSIRVTLLRAAFPDVDPSRVRLRASDHNCQPKYNATHVILVSPLTRCGTVHVLMRNKQVYHNVVRGIRPVIAIRCEYILERRMFHQEKTQDPNSTVDYTVNNVLFENHYAKDMNALTMHEVSEVALSRMSANAVKDDVIITRAMSTGIPASAGKIGEYTASVLIYENGNFTELLSHFRAGTLWNETIPLYVQVKLAGSSDLSMIAGECKLQICDVHNQRLCRFSIITKRGCWETGNTTLLHNSSHKVRFLVHASLMNGSDTTVKVVCDVDLYNTTTQNIHRYYLANDTHRMEADKRRQQHNNNFSCNHDNGSNCFLNNTATCDNGNGRNCSLNNTATCDHGNGGNCSLNNTATCDHGNGHNCTLNHTTNTLSERNNAPTGKRVNAGYEMDTERSLDEDCKCFHGIQSLNSSSHGNEVNTTNITIPGNGNNQSNNANTSYHNNSNNVNCTCNDVTVSVTFGDRCFGGDFTNEAAVVSLEAQSVLSTITRGNAVNSTTEDVALIQGQNITSNLTTLPKRAGAHQTDQEAILMVEGWLYAGLLLVVVILAGVAYCVRKRQERLRKEVSPSDECDTLDTGMLLKEESSVV